MPLITVQPLKTSVTKIPFKPKKPLVCSLSSTELTSLRKSKKTGDVLKILQPMHKLLWFFAPLPYDISEVNGIFQATVTENKFLFYLVYLIIRITTMTEAIMHQTRATIGNTIRNIHVVATVVFCIALYLYKKGTVKILNKIAELDGQLIQLGYGIKYKFYIYLVKIVIMAEVMVSILIWKKPNFLSFSLSKNLFYLVNTYLTLITGFYFCYIVICIMLTNNMLKNLNMFLLDISKSNSTEIRNTNLKIIRKMYSDIWHVTRCLNLNFNIIITIICGICFINSITAVYIWWQSNGITSRAYTLQWIIIHLAKLFVLSLVCNNAKEEEEKLLALLQNMYEKAFNEGRHEKFTMDQFLMQMMHEKMEYWACEMFPINKTFICSVIVVGTMNAILLLQLGMSKVQHQPLHIPS